MLCQVQTQFRSCRAGEHLGLAGDPSLLPPTPLALSLAVGVGLVWPQSHPRDSPGQGGQLSPAFIFKEKFLLQVLLTKGEV